MGEETSRAFQALTAAGIDDQCETMRAALAICFKNYIKKGEDKQQIAALLGSLLEKLDSEGMCTIRIALYRVSLRSKKNQI